MGSGQLQRELKKKRPFESLEQEALLNLLRTNDQFQNQIGRLFREYGLTSSQYNVLRILRGAPRDGVPCQYIGERLLTRWTAPHPADGLNLVANRFVVHPIANIPTAGIVELRFDVRAWRHIGPHHLTSSRFDYPKNKPT